MATGTPFFPSTHRLSHCTSWGQTRPQIPGRLFFLFKSLDCSRHVALTQGQDEGRDLYTYGTALHALGLLALDASFGLLGRLL